MDSTHMLVPEDIREYVISAVAKYASDLGFKRYVVYPVNSYVRGYATATSDYRVVMLSPEIDLSIAAPKARPYEYGEVVFMSVKRFLRNIYRGSINALMLAALVKKGSLIVDRGLHDLIHRCIDKIIDLLPKLRTVYEKAIDILREPPRKFGRACFMVFTARFVTALAGLQNVVNAYEVTYRSMGDVREFRNEATIPDDIVKRFSKDIDIAIKVSERMCEELEKVEVYRSKFNEVYREFIEEYIAEFRR